MIAVARRREESIRPAFLAALALHLALLAWISFVAKPASTLPLGTAVPITIVSSAPITDSRKAEAAPVAREAQTETPVPQAKSPQPAVAPAPVPARPAPTRPSPLGRAKPTPSLNLDALQASLAKSAHTAPARPAMARRGLAQIESDLQARVDAGHGISQSDQQGLQQLLERLWNPNCAVEGANAVVVPVRFQIGIDGQVASRVSAGGRENAADPVLAAAARRAIDAVHAVAPYPAVYRGQTFTVNFNAKSACANR